MIQKRVVPSFQSEAEEADWWFTHQDEFDHDFAEAAANGTLAHGSAAATAGFSTAFQFDPEDLKLAQEQAKKLGLEYHAYVRRLFHEALTREAAA